MARRKFDDVASLFGAIVPPAGSPVRPQIPQPASSLPQVAESELSTEDGPQLEAPPKLRAPPSEPMPLRPAADPLRAPATLSISAPIVLPQARVAAEPAPVAAAKPAGARAEKGPRLERKAEREVPWPDAFAPRPNYKATQKSRLLYWLFLIPFAVVVAAAVTLVDPRSIRNFIDHSLPQYLPAEVTQLFARRTPAPPAVVAPVETPPQAVAPSPPAETVPAPSPTPSVVPSPSAPAPPETPAVAPGPPAAVQGDAAEVAPPPPAVGNQTPSPAPASDTSQPIPVPPAPLPSPSPPPPVAAVGGAARVTIYYRRNQAGSESEARRVAAKLGNAEIRPSGNTVRSPMIYYFNPADRDAATGLARSLAGEGAGWIVRAGPTRQTAGAIDILLP